MGRPTMGRSKSRSVVLRQQLTQHLDAAFNLAYWLVENKQDGEDLVQEAFMKALLYEESYQGGDLRAWILTIVRNCVYSHYHRREKSKLEDSYDESTSELTSPIPNPEHFVAMKFEWEHVQTVLLEIPLEYREALLLHEMEGYSYKEISEITGAPIGTVMSRLSRARSLLSQQLQSRKTDSGAKQ